MSIAGKRQTREECTTTNNKIVSEEVPSDQLEPSRKKIRIEPMTPQEDKPFIDAPVPPHDHDNHDNDKYQYDLSHDIAFSVKVIKMLSSAKKNPKPIIPLSCCKKKILVLDLDETLVYNSHGTCPKSDFNYQVFHEGLIYDFNCRLRPHLYEFLEEVSKDWILITWTASMQKVAEPLINYIDPKRKYLTHVLYRDSCLNLKGAYIKDLQVFGRDMKDVIILDNNPLTFTINPSNGVPILSWYGEQKEDDALTSVLAFFKKLSQAEDVRPIIDSRFGFLDKINDMTNTTELSKE
ncbi:CTD small phosphatase-like protein [Acrasis kona]|uniref:CTD small phosphatase-like protein n=1 Tax=Acrasis kona TaxID=1008807 RepID=A0AAW2YM59_9EUKA